LAGEYQDRRHLTTVDCSQTIWILATNAHDSVIQDFCTQNNQALFADDDESQKILLTKKLAKEVRHDFLRTFGVSKIL
jgi:ATP-dependent Clp protease ATP-binding subunit ClpA